MTKIIHERAELQALAHDLRLRGDWHEPDEVGVTARVEGTNFDNAGFWPAENRFAPGPDGVEMHVILSADGADVAAVNLATLFGWAAESNG